jgi:alkylhydroperoxidase family enzyme
MLEQKPTLEYRLRPHAVPLEVLHKKYPSVLNVVNRILGLVPRCDGYLEIWPPAFVTYNVLVPNLFDIPRCDLGMGIPTSLRSVIAHVASRTYGCNYCSAHTAVMGTIFRGPGGDLKRNADALDPQAQGKFTDGEKAAMAWATALAHVPADVSTDVRLAVARHYSDADQESIALAATIMGFLNRFMDTTGMVLEWEALNTSTEHLSRTGWKAGINFDEKFDAELVAAERAYAAQKKKLPSLIPSVIGAIAYDRRALGGIPKRRDQIVECLKESLGFEPEYVHRIGRIPPKRAFAHMLVERLNRAGDEIEVWLKHAMCFVAATYAKNPLLQAHAAFFAVRAGASPERLAKVLDVAGLRTSFTAREAAALELAHAASPAPTAMTVGLANALMAAFGPPGVIESVVVMSMFNALQRWTAAYPSVRYEAPIEAFVQEHGALLGLAPSPATPEQASWDERIAALRRG